MKTAVILLILLTLFSPNLVAQDYTQWGLPEGVKVRLGKGGLTGNSQYSPDGTRFAVASTIGIWLYNTETYQEVALFTGHTEEVLSLAFSPDGKTLASGGYDKTVRLWNVLTSENIRTLTGHGSSVAFSPDGFALASGSSGDTITVGDVTTGEHKWTLTGHKHANKTVVFSPDGETFASSGFQTIRLWDAVTGEHKRALTGHAERVSSVAFSPDGKTLASGSWDQTVRLWDVATGKHKATLTGHTDMIMSVTFSADGRTLASGGMDCTVLLWDLAPSQPAKE